jgi:hypothetical protein
MRLRIQRASSSVALACGISVLLAASSALFPGCTSDQVKKAAQAAQDISVSINLAIEVKRDLLGQKLITNQQAVVIDQILLELNSADREFAKGVDAFKAGKLGKAGLIKIFAGVNAAIQDLNNKGVLQITDPKAKAELSSITAGLAVAAGVVQAALGSS